MAPRVARRPLSLSAGARSRMLRTSGPERWLVSPPSEAAEVPELVESLPMPVLAACDIVFSAS